MSERGQAEKQYRCTYRVRKASWASRREVLLCIHCSQARQNNQTTDNLHIFLPQYRASFRLEIRLRSTRRQANVRSPYRLMQEGEAQEKWHLNHDLAQTYQTWRDKKENQPFDGWCYTFCTRLSDKLRHTRRNVSLADSLIHILTYRQQIFKVFYKIVF